MLHQICFKLSLALFFLRIVTRQWQKTIIIITAIGYAALATGMIFITVFQCGNPSKSSTLYRGTLNCLDWETTLGPIWYFAASMNAVVDWIFALTPIMVIRKLHMGQQDRISVILVILLAISGSVICVVKVPYISGLEFNVSAYKETNDIIAYLSIIESAIGLIAVSLAVLRPLVRQWTASARAMLARRGSNICSIQSPVLMDAVTPQPQERPQGIADLSLTMSTDGDDSKRNPVVTTESIYSRTAEDRA